MQGILHAGAVLDPGIVTNIALGSVRNEFGGKVQGASSMAKASALAPLTSFNLFSSLASFSGSGGQAGYAAANGVLDSWAQSMQVASQLQRLKVGSAAAVHENWLVGLIILSRWTKVPQSCCFLFCFFFLLRNLAAAQYTQHSCWQFSFTFWFISTLRPAVSPI